MSPGSRRASPQSAREVVELDRDEAMRLLASVDHGRVVFTRAALPAIRPVNHLVKVSVAVRSSADAGVVVAYEADDLDPRRRTGWSVVVTGLATEVSDPEQVARYQRLLHPWVNMAMDTVVAIEPEIVTGIRIVADSRTP